MAKKTRGSKKRTTLQGKTRSKTPLAKKASKPLVLTAAIHRAVFNDLTLWAGMHKQAPVCYQPLGNGSWLICYLQKDGSRECQPYDGPVHEPICP
jgi:hypothetical protein